MWFQYANEKDLRSLSEEGATSVSGVSGFVPPSLRTEMDASKNAPEVRLSKIYLSSILHKSCLCEGD